jgi:hypothetical protein
MNLPKTTGVNEANGVIDGMRVAVGVGDLPARETCCRAVCVAAATEVPAITVLIAF